MKVIALLLFCYACLSTVNGKVYFVSKNFHNVLHWDVAAPAHPGEEVLCSVQYHSDAADQRFLMKEGCQNITALVCDLTAETPSVHDVNYRARVCCNGDSCGTTTRFKPIAQTALGAPALSTHATASSLHVDVTVPLGPDGVSVADIITTSKKLPYETGLVYTLNITRPPWAAQVNERTTGQFVIDLKKGRTEYCGYVVYKPETESGRPESERAPFCVTLPGDPLELLPWLLVGAALLAATIATSVVCICKYVNGGKGKSMPQILVISSSTTPTHMQSLDGYLSISKPEIYIKSEERENPMIQGNPEITPLSSGAYSPQDNLGLNWPDGTGSSVGTEGRRGLTPDTEDTSAQSSETYGVVAVQEHNRDVPPATGNRRMLALPHEEPGEDVGVGRRDANGQLVLQIQSSGDGRGTPLGPERTPRLSDLIDSGTDGTDGPSLASLKSFDGSEFWDSGCDDSGVTTPTHTYCNGHYPLSQPDSSYLQQGWTKASPGGAARGSGYKQNCFTTMLHGTPSKDVCGYRTTGYDGRPTNEEGGRKEGDSEVEETRQILLGGWVT
ncbi:interferon lambda receptor 1 isoform X1 [Gasterosteus aculeatus]